MPSAFRPLTIAVLLGATAWLSPVHGQQVETAGPAGESAFETETHHALAVDGIQIEYLARTGMLRVPPEDDTGRQGQMFYVAYSVANGGDRHRPVTFVFNGGPGAAAAYLHLGLMGPRRLQFADDGRVDTVPRLVDNAESWLRFSDLVFVDPVGTGFSRPLRRDPDKSGDGKDRSGERNERGDRDFFWNTDRDLDALGAFIRLYLTRNGLWLAPVVLAGESYGGFRVAALADRLQGDFGISVAGLVMISPVLEFDMLSTDRFRLMPWVALVPSYAATARHHGTGLPGEGEVESERLPASERFAIDTLLPALAKGRTLSEAERTALFADLAELVGLPVDVVARHDGKIPSSLLASRLLESQGRVLSVYDASISYAAPHPLEGRYRDARLDRISAAVAAAFNDHVRNQLGLNADLPYEVLNKQVSRQWVWQEGRGRRGPPGVAENLESALRTVPGLQALVAHGVYDLVTPYFASAYVVNQFDLEPEARRRLIFRTYEGGHMFYSHSEARTAFYADARRFYGALDGNPGEGE